MVNHVNLVNREAENKCTTSLTQAIKPLIEKNLALKLNAVIQTINYHVDENLNPTHFNYILPEIRKQMVDLNNCRLAALRLIEQCYTSNIDNDIPNDSNKNRIKHNTIEYVEDLISDSIENNAKQTHLNYPSLYPVEKIREYLQILKINKQKNQKEIIQLLHDPYSDLTFVCRDYSFKFPSALLKDYIYYIASATNYDSSKTHHVFDLKEFEESENLCLPSDRILKFLVWLYTGRILLEAEDAFELARFVNGISDHPDVFKIFKDYLNERPLLCLPLFLAMQGNPSMHMKQIIKEVCCDHSKLVFDSPGFLDLSFDFLVEMFSLDLKLTDNDILLYLSKWIKHHKSLEYFENSASSLDTREDAISGDENFLSDEKLKDCVLTQSDACKLLEKSLDLKTLDKHRYFIIEKFFITEKQFETIILLKKNQDIQFNLCSHIPSNSYNPFVVHTLSENHMLIKWKTNLKLPIDDSRCFNIYNFKSETHNIKINHELYKFHIGFDLKEEFDPLAPPKTPSYCVKPRFYIMVLGLSSGANTKMVEIDLQLQSDQSAVWDLITTSTPSFVESSTHHKVKTFYFECRNTFQYAIKTQTTPDINYYMKYKQFNHNIELSINIKTKENFSDFFVNANNIKNLIALNNLSDSVITAHSAFNSLYHTNEITFKATALEIKKKFLDYSLQFSQLVTPMISIPDAPIRPDPDATYLYKAEQLNDKTWTYPLTSKKLYVEGTPILDLKNSVAYRDKAEFAVEINGTSVRYHSFILNKYPFLSKLQAYVLEHNLSVDTVKKIIEYLYTDTIILTTEDIIDIYYIALFLQFDKLKKLCYTKLNSEDFLKAENALELLQKINIGPDIEDFETHILIFIRSYFYSCFFINKNEELTLESIRPIFYKIRKENLLTIFKNTNLNTSEACLFFLLSEFLKNNDIQYNSFKEAYSKFKNCTLSFCDYVRYEVQKELLSTINFKLLFSQNLSEAFSLMQNAKIKDIQIFTNEEILNLQIMANQFEKAPVGLLSQKFIEDHIDKPIRHYEVWKNFDLNEEELEAVKIENDFAYCIWQIQSTLVIRNMYMSTPISFLGQQFRIRYEVEKTLKGEYDFKILLEPENRLFFHQESAILEKIQYTFIFITAFDREDVYRVENYIQCFDPDDIEHSSMLLYSRSLGSTPDQWPDKSSERFILNIQQLE